MRSSTLFYLRCSFQACSWPRKSRANLRRRTAKGRRLRAFDPWRRNTRVRSGANAVAPIVDDFDEALKLVQENYVDGANGIQLRSQISITGMLRSLDPHSNYFAKKSSMN